MDGDTTERLSQESQCPDAKEHGLLARASAFAGGVLSSIQALAGTTACKGVQIGQIHAFREGNTRTTAIFTIQYLRSLGYEVNNEMFAKHSWYFRNALVRANYRNIQKGIDYSPIYLVRFFRNLLLKDGWVLKNRYLHIQPTDDWKEQPRIGTPQVPHKFCQHVETLVKCMDDTYMSSAEIMKSLGLKDRKSFSKLYLNVALSENAIERKYPDTPKHPRQQYRLTPQAKVWKENNKGV